MFTQGKDDTIIAHSKIVPPRNVFFSTFCVFKTKILLLCSFFCIYVCVDDKVEAFPVLKISPKDIVDTNGAGDAFVGGGNLRALRFHFKVGC